MERVMIVAAIVMILGLLLWAMPLPPKVQEGGKIAFVIGLFFVVWALTGRGFELHLK